MRRFLRLGEKVASQSGLTPPPDRVKIALSR